MENKIPKDKSLKGNKYIFIVGGTISGVGKGVAAASLSLLLKNHTEWPVFQIKIDPYLNTYPGLLNPEEHGEIFVTEDGYEGDLDLGHYERFTLNKTSAKNNLTTGQLFQSLRAAEENLAYMGKTIQIKRQLKDLMYQKISNDLDGHVIVVEFGGSLGDLELHQLLSNIENMLQDNNVKSEDTYVILTSYVIYFEHLQEFKTRTVERDMEALRRENLKADLVILRSHRPLSDEVVNHLKLKCKIAECINIPDVEQISQVTPYVYSCLKNLLTQLRMSYHDQSSSYIGLPAVPIVKTHKVKIACICKYRNFRSSYQSIYLALQDASNLLGIELEKIQPIYIGFDVHFDEAMIKQIIQEYDGFILTGGYGVRGIEDYMNFVHACRVSKKPTLGICLGMQIMLVEFARNVCGMIGAGSAEWTQDKNVSKIFIKRKYSPILGLYNISLKPNTHILQIYSKPIIQERYRHKYVFNNKYSEIIQDKGFTLSSFNDSMVASCEIDQNQFYIGVQYHAEFSSNPYQGHPLFIHFLQACIKQ